jgi:LmbE family N-acetylglucosaminyl deacetylase
MHLQPDPGSPDNWAEALLQLKVVVTGGHPGDPEYGCGGTIARYVEEGHEVVLLYLNNGEVADPENINAHKRGARTLEAQNSCEILQVRPLFAPQVDGSSIVDAPHYEEYRQILEAEQPDLVFTHWPIDNHADHRANWMLVYDAWLTMGKRFGLYYYEVSDGEDTLMFSPSHYIDITSAEPRKRAACYAHASQSPERYYAVQERITAFRGVESGCRHAEGYIRQRQSAVDLPLAR